MAARRLIIVMVILLGISTAIAIFVPDPKKDDPQEETTGPTGSTGSTGTTGAAGDSDSGSAPPEPGRVDQTVKAGEGVSSIAAKPGDRVVLRIEPSVPVDVEIKALGLTATATDFAPAVFDFIMPSKPESFEVTQIGNDRLLASVSSSPHNLEAKQRLDRKNEKNEAAKEPAK